MRTRQMPRAAGNGNDRFCFEQSSLGLCANLVLTRLRQRYNRLDAFLCGGNFPWIYFLVLLAGTARGFRLSFQFKDFLHEKG